MSKFSNQTHKLKNKRLYLEIARGFEPEREREREDTDLERDLERREDLGLGDLLHIIY